VITTIAGTGTAGFAGDGGPADAAPLNNPTDLDIGADGTLYIADTRNSCVRAVYTDGTIGTVAGVCGQAGFSGDGGAATDALLDRPYGIELDREDNLYIVDTYNHRIRIVAP
jgi:sugar lactone lactonase YvrE